MQWLNTDQTMVWYSISSIILCMMAMAFGQRFFEGLSAAVRMVRKPGIAVHKTGAARQTCEVYFLQSLREGLPEWSNIVF